VSSTAGSPVGGHGSLQRFTTGFARASVLLSTLALLVAVGLAVAGVDLVAPLVASDLDPRNTLADPPTDAPLVTWWSGSARPGSEHGQTVLTGHATEAGGALTAMAELGKGDVVDLLTREGTMRYQVSTVRTYDPTAMDRAAITLFKQDGGADRLVLVSAEAWDGSGYPRSVVVTAAPLGRPLG